MWKKYISETSCTESFPWDFSACRVISFVGGGGKTTLMDYWARLLAAKYNKVLVTTTTHLQMPPVSSFAMDSEEIHRIWDRSFYAVIGTAEGAKISTPNGRLLERAVNQADYVLIEADGSKHLPCKIPNETEPVIYEKTDLVVAVFGMSALGKPIKEVCFRLTETEQFLEKKRGEVLTEEDAAKILSSKQGSRKAVGDRAYVVVLNQCDTIEQRLSAERIARMLLKQGVAHILLVSFSEQERGLFDRGNRNE